MVVVVYAQYEVNFFPQLLHMPAKISIRLCIPKMVYFILCTIGQLQLHGQDSSYTRPPVVDKWKHYREIALHDSTQRMIELTTIIPSLVYDLRYSGTNNFMHRRMYPAGTKKTFLRLPAAHALKNIQDELKSKGLGLKIFDAYRPFSVTVKFWELVRDERYVANPSKGSGHNRGIAVDLTIINLKSGKELDMGTGFDNFSDTAHSYYALLPQNVLDNRKLLRTVMEKYGFKVFETEWWHFYLPESSKYEILDLSFKELLKKL
jgi:zinc D-Ala-D-Ala dipeptidase